jgi:hypothetical protein
MVAGPPIVAGSADVAGAPMVAGSQKGESL